MNSTPQAALPLLLSAALTSAVAGILYAAGPDYLPHSRLVLQLTVIACAFRTGVAGGMISAGLSLLYVAWTLSGDGELFHYTLNQLEQLLLWALCLPLAALLTGTLRRKSVRLESKRAAAEKREGEMTAMLEELRAAREEALERERRYRFLADSMPQMVWTSRPDGTPDYFNRRWLDFTDNQIAEIAAGDLLRIMHPDDVAGRTEAWRRAIDSGEPYQSEYRLRHAGDHSEENWRWHLSRAEPLTDETGRVLQWVGTCTDIHEQYVARGHLERRVRERTAELERANESLTGEIAAHRSTRHAIDRILTHSRDIICTIGRHGHIVRISMASRHVLGYDPGELEGRFVGELIHPEDRAAAAANAQEIIAGKSTGEFLERWLRKDGAIIFMMLSATWSEEDQLMFCIGRDISSMRKASEDLKTARLAAEEASRAKSDFLAMMSHEIRTPMNGVLGMAGLLLDTRLSPDQRILADTIRQSGEMLLTIINDILDFSKIEAGKLVFETVDFDLQEAVDGTLELLGAAARAKGIELLGEVDPTVPVRLRGDEGRLRQILTNLVGNAIKFTDKGGEVHLQVLAHGKDAAGRAVIYFGVRDTGIGMDADALKRLFQPFTQADISTTRKYGGTGLGLAICHRLVSLMGGEISVRSEPGQGSVFYFTAGFDLQPGNADSASGARREMAGLKVLAVDDNAVNLSILRRRLGSWRMRCTTAASAREALELLRKAADSGHPFDAAVLDWQMPEMDGLSLAREIRADERLADTHLVMFSSVDTAGGPAVLEPLGIRDYLLKPLRPSRLFNALSPAISGEPGISGEGAADQQAGPSPACPARILLAEDNPVNQRVALMLLGKLGRSANAVSNGREAVEAAVSVPYDIILMDCQMPEMDGYEASRRIRELEAQTLTAAASPAHIIALTANAMSGDREKCLAAGMSDYIAKPMRLSDLREALGRWEKLHRPS